MTYFLDTNIILILFQGREKEITKEVAKILSDDKNTFFASVISLNEITQLYRKKKIKELDYQKYDTAQKFIKTLIKEMHFVIFGEFSQKHALIVSKLNFVPKHNDPNDLAIIAHAMGEKMVVISTDKNFPSYEKQGAKVIFNQR